MFDRTKFNELINAQTWEGVYGQTDPEIAYNIFIDKFLDMYNMSTKKLIETNTYKKIKPWITNAIIISIKKVTK